MKEQIYGPGELLFKKNDSDAKIILLKKGEILFYDLLKNNKK